MSMETMDYVANLREAIRLVEAQPESQLQLSVFRADSVCGTVACSAGLCAMSQYFRERGMRAHGRGWTVIYGAPYMMQIGPLGPVRLDEFATLNHFFGTYPGEVRGQRYDAYSVLFAPRGRGRWDDALIQLYREASADPAAPERQGGADGPLEAQPVGQPYALPGARPNGEPSDKQLALMRLNRALMQHLAAAAPAVPTRTSTAVSTLARIAQRVGFGSTDRSETV